MSDSRDLGPERKSRPDDKTPQEPMRALRPSTYSPTEEITKYAPPPKEPTMAAANKFDWKHGALTACGLGSVLVEALSSQQGSSVALAMHCTAGGLFVASMIFGYISHSLTSDALPPVVVAVSSNPNTPAITVPSVVQPAVST
jgi:hypothetical protein